MNQTRLKIDGMHCDACVRRVRTALEKVPGVSVKHVAVGTATVERDPQQADDATLKSVIDDQGFTLQGVESAG